MTAGAKDRERRDAPNRGVGSWTPPSQPSCHPKQRVNSLARTSVAVLPIATEDDFVAEGNGGQMRS
jgi:hypothetical protein